MTLEAAYRRQTAPAANGRSSSRESSYALRPLGPTDAVPIANHLTHHQPGSCEPRSVLREEEQGRGWRVIIRTWFDAAGTTQDEARSVGVVRKTTGDVVPIQLEDGRLLQFDLATRRLV